MNSSLDRQADVAITEGAGILLHDDCYVEPKGPDQRIVVMKEKDGHTATVMIVEISDIRVADETATLIQNGEPVEGYTDLPIIRRAHNVRRI